MQSIKMIVVYSKQCACLIRLTVYTCCAIVTLACSETYGAVFERNISLTPNSGSARKAFITGLPATIP